MAGEKSRYRRYCESVCEWCKAGLYGGRTQNDMYYHYHQRDHCLEGEEACAALSRSAWAEQESERREDAEQRAADAWKRGAKAMRESIIDALWNQGINVDPELLNIRALPIPEEPAPKPLTREERIARSLAVLREEPRIKLTPEEWRVLMEEEREGGK